MTRFLGQKSYTMVSAVSKSVTVQEQYSSTEILAEKVKNGTLGCRWNEKAIMLKFNKPEKKYQKIFQ